MDGIYRLFVYQKMNSGGKDMERLLNTLGPQMMVTGGYSFFAEIKGVVFELRWMLVMIVGQEEGLCASLLSTTATWYLDL